MAEERTVIHCKRKNIQVLIDYCLDQKLYFSVAPRTVSLDELEVEVVLSSIRQAVALGMFARENKLEVVGLGEFAKTKSTPVKKAEVRDVPVNTTAEAIRVGSKEENTLLSFDLNVNGN